MPVFYDPSGRRWRRIVAGLILAVLLLSALTAWLAPQALEPTRPQPVNQALEYPRELLGTGRSDDVPVIGDAENSAFVRMTLVKRVDGKTVLADPFSDEILREVTSEEEAAIGPSPYAVERFGEPADGQLILTFDDGPNAEFTQQILDVLAEENVPATFFNIGTNVVDNPDLFRRQIDEGHMVGNHTMTHLTDWTGSARENRGQLIGADRIMRSIGAYATPLVRLPEGQPESKPLALLHAQQLGYVNVDMDLDTEDWTYTPDEIIPMPELDGRGHVVVMHDGGIQNDRSATVTFVKRLIAEARAAGYTFTTLEPLLADEIMPVGGIDPTPADHATLFAVAAWSKGVDAVVYGLFWFWTGIVALMSLVYVVLAIVGHRRHRRRIWRNVPEHELPLVSIILPVFNEEPVVLRTLEALRGSDYPRLEVIAVDDGSTDGTLSVLQSYAATWSRLKVLTQPNGGKSMASNHGIMEARGEIVVTIDGDTIFEPTTIRMLARHFHSGTGQREVGAVAGHVKVGNRRNILTLWQSLEYITGICINRMAESVASAVSIAPGACTAWRMEALRQAGGYSHDTLAEDMDLTLAIRRLGYEVVQDNEAVAWTEAPMRLGSLAKQRVRWTYGYLQALRKYSDMILRPRYGTLGLVALPFGALSIFVPMAYLPLTVIVASMKLAASDWVGFAEFALIGVAIYGIVSVLALRMVKERTVHLIMVPIYFVVYVPLRMYVLYASLLQALRGRMIGWYKPERTNSVQDISAPPANNHRVVSA